MPIFRFCSLTTLVNSIHCLRAAYSCRCSMRFRFRRTFSFCSLSSWVASYHRSRTEYSVALTHRVIAFLTLCCSSIASSLNSIQRLKHFASDPMNQWPAACRVRFWSPANADMRRNALLSSRLVHILTHCCSFCRRWTCSWVVSTQER